MDQNNHIMGHVANVGGDSIFRTQEDGNPEFQTQCDFED